MGRLAQGVEDLNRSILLHPRATPEFFLERAELQKRMGDITGAVRGLKEGIELLGPIVSLIDTMVKLEVSAGRYDSALQHIQLLPQLLRGQAPWRARRAGILMQAGRREEAAREYESALRAIDELPSRRAGTRAILELGVQIQHQLTVLNGI